MQTEKKLKKKLLFVVTLAELGGAQKYVRDLSEILKSKYEITIAANTRDDSLLSWAKENSIRIFPLKNLKRELTFGILPTFGDLRTFRDLLAHIRRERYDIVHLNSSKMGFVGALAARTAQTPKIVFTAHGWVFNEPKSLRKKRWLWVLISRLAARFQDQIICVSNYDLDQAVVKKIAPPRKLVTVHNGIDANRITYLPRAKPRLEIEKMIDAEPDTIIAATVANSYPAKDLETMIHTVGAVKNQKLKLVIIGGEGPQPHSDLKRLVENLGVRDKVYLLGRIENSVQYLKAFDLYLISSKKEGLPFSALEAMAAGLPIVSTGVGGLAEILFANPKKPAGLEFTPGNVQEMAKKIEEVIKDKELADTFAKNAKECVESQFSLDNMVEKTRWVWEV